MITNVVVAPNIFLKAYRGLTFAVKATIQLALSTSGFAFSRSHDLLAEDIIVYGNEADAITAGVDYDDASNLIVLNSTKKAIIRFNEHASVPSQQFIAAYCLQDNPTIQSYNGMPVPSYLLAKDGDEIEIYGVDEIRKFKSFPLIGDLNPVPYYLTITLFN